LFRTTDASVFMPTGLKLIVYILARFFDIDGHSSSASIS
jgi:hypothetical protein